MTVLSYPFAWFPAVIVFGVLATAVVPLFAFVWLLVFLVAVLAGVVTLGWGLAAALAAVGRRLSHALSRRSSTDARTASASSPYKDGRLTDQARRRAR